MYSQISWCRLTADRRSLSPLLKSFYPAVLAQMDPEGPQRFRTGVPHHCAYPIQPARLQSIVHPDQYRSEVSPVMEIGYHN